MNTYVIDFQPVGRRGECRADEALIECAGKRGVTLVNVCGGVGSCGRCQVVAMEGELTEVTAREREALTAEQLAQGRRLACQAFPRSDSRLLVPPESLTTPQRTQVEGQEIPVRPDPLVEQITLDLAPPSLGNGEDLGDLRDDETRVLEGLRIQHELVAERIDIDVLRMLSPRLRAQDWRVRVAVRDGEVIHAGALSGSLLGLAVDLGTTKIAGYLVDLESGKTLAAAGIMNPQIAYGEDVVGRSTRAQRSPEDGARMQELVTEALNGLAAALGEEVGVTAEEIVSAVVVGNTAMHHLFLGLPVRQLIRAPYVPATRNGLEVKARDVRLELAPGASVYLLPNIAGYVGADHVAVLLATEMARAQGVVLAIDIGTNTEVCLVNQGRLTSTSCASGPAFEGAHIRWGMRAASGAIEYLRLSEDEGGYRCHCQTIGDAPPVGLCGSGILDALAEIRRVGIVDAGGRMQEGPGVQTVNGERAFVLVPEEASGLDTAITITQKDVRELQLAKGAMRAGIQLLLEAQGLSEERIDEVVIAGAFGSYINVESAVAIGMLPDLPLDRFRQVGNAAGVGAKLALLSGEKRREAETLARSTGYLELSTTPQFRRRFAEAMELR